MFRAVAFSWFSLVLISFVTELHSQYAPIADKYASQQHWLTDCKSPSHWHKYKTECGFHANQHYPSFFAQWMDAVLHNVKWCGVDQCQSIFSLKGLVVSVVVGSLIQGGPKLAKKGWYKFNHE
jgi:hypothetical protein